MERKKTLMKQLVKFSIFIYVSGDKVTDKRAQYKEKDKVFRNKGIKQQVAAPIEVQPPRLKNNILSNLITSAGTSHRS